MNDANRIPDELFPQQPAQTGDAKSAPAAAMLDLMPYEKVAKAIFVKANGLPAYTLATRFVRYTD